MADSTLQCSGTVKVYHVPKSDPTAELKELPLRGEVYSQIGVNPKGLKHSIVREIKAEGNCCWSFANISEGKNETFCPGRLEILNFHPISIQRHDRCNC